MGSRTIYADQDDILIAIADGPLKRKVYGRDLIKLPPWRAWLICQIMRNANHPIEDLEYQDILEEATRVGGTGKLDLERMLALTTKGK